MHCSNSSRSCSVTSPRILVLHERASSLRGASLPDLALPLSFIGRIHHLCDMCQGFHHMIFNRCDADSQTLMNLTIAKFFDTVHQQNSSRLLADACNGQLIRPEEIGSFNSKFLSRRKELERLVLGKK